MERLKQLLSSEQIKSLKAKNKAVIIDGPQGSTGKTTLKNILKENGYIVYEEYEVTRIIMENPYPS